MTYHILPGDPPVPLVLRRSARARRISLRVSQSDGRVTLTLPKGVPDREALAFAQEKAAWIRGHLETRGEDIRIGLGEHIPVEGQMREIAIGGGRSVRIEPELIQLPRAGAAGARVLRAALRTLARDRLVAASDRYAKTLGRDYARITLRDTRSRWGSCSSSGGLMYSWRLIMAPPEVLAYVAAHEVAHLAEMNHGPRFWETVTQLFGPYDTPRAWLRREGQTLHRYRFDD